MNMTFKYLRPKTLREACVLKDKHGKAAVFWAGGTDLLLEWREGVIEPEYCIDLSFISDLDYIKCGKEQIFIASLAKVASIQDDSPLKKMMPMLSEAASQLATPQIRNIATIGGNLCHATPSADLAVPLLALNAETKLVSVSGERWVVLKDFFLGVNKTVLKENELLVEIRVPIPPHQTAACFLKLGRTVVDIALVNSAVQITVDKGGTFTDVRIALGAVAPTPIRSKTAEQMLLGVNIAELNKNLVEEAGLMAASEAKPITDVRASAEYRREISKVLVRRAIEDVIQKLEGRME